MCFSITFVLIAIIATILFIFFERFCSLSPDGESGLKLCEGIIAQGDAGVSPRMGRVG